jgi:NAD(P)-dependent dehydrogenase (short-subunit alcohol dehydrogenase family)
MASLEDLVRLLEELAANPDAVAALPDDARNALLGAAGRLSRPNRDEIRARARAFRRRDRASDRAHDLAQLTRARTRGARKTPHFALPPSTVDPRTPVEPPTENLRQARACYVCKAEYVEVHHFYHSMCRACGDFNFAKRSQTADLHGQVAIVTGGRIKIGYETALILLRAGARVVVTTRFAADAARRFAATPDAPIWADRLSVHALDLRDLPGVERLGDELAATLPRLDILVHNAAQTVRRPPEFYRHLVEAEAALPPAAQKLLAAPPTALAPIVREAPLAEAIALFPPGRLDGDGQQVDLRAHNSWRMRLHEVGTLELLEVMLVNAAAPFVLTARLRSLMERAPTEARHIINVSAMEAAFTRKKKTDKHPHTNMAKAALNMMTRTSATDFAASGIFMNSVDTGWVTDEDPLHHVERKQAVHDFHAPLDAIDGAARVLDPLFTGLQTGQHPFGLFWKDYRPIPW